LKVIKHDLFVHVPSGKMRIWGQSWSDVALLMISLMVFWRESGSSLQTYTGWVKLISSGKAVWGQEGGIESGLKRY
jgi:hypothetical protein